MCAAYPLGLSGWRNCFYQTHYNWGNVLLSYCIRVWMHLFMVFPWNLTLILAWDINYEALFWDFNAFVSVHNSTIKREKLKMEGISDVPNQCSSKQLKTSCLLCFNVVYLSPGSTLRKRKCDLKRSRLLKTFCVQLKLPVKEIPAECPGTKFPICDICEENLEDVSCHQKRIFTIVDRLETKVRTGVAVARTTVKDGDERFTKLWDMIVDGK